MLRAMKVLRCRVADTEDELGRRIGLQREAIGVSRETLADALGWFEAQIEDCENGLFSPSQTDVVTIAAVLGVSTDFLQQGRGLRAAQVGAPLSGALDARAIDLFGAFSRIRDPHKRSLLIDLAVSLAGTN